jgi:predicted nucleotide-binding protein
MTAKLTKLQALIDVLQAKVEHDAAEAAPAHSSPQKPEPGTKRVFVVHGHDRGSLSEVARLLQKLELEPIILHEQPNEGRTIIEKFEDYSDVSFAVVLLTPDDIGAPRGTQYEELKPRARQNVIFELGYFSAKLTRKHVCALYTAGVEKPSDYDGVLYIAIDDHGAWKYRLAKEMLNAQLPIDLHKI